MTETSSPSSSPVRWDRSYRIIATRYPPIALFERVAPPEDWDALVEIASLTNDRIRDEIGDIQLVPPEDRLSGPGASWVMASFTHVGFPSCFSDGGRGVYYTAGSLECAVAETYWHQGNFLRATDERPTTVAMRVLRSGLDGLLHDLRGRQGDFPAVYDPDDYSASQAFARRLRDAGTDGIVFDSVRLAGGVCAAVFRPTLVQPLPVSDRCLQYHWDGQRIDRWFDHSTDRWTSFWS